MKYALILLAISGTLASAAPVVNYTCHLYERSVLRYTGSAADPTCAQHIPGMSVEVDVLDYNFGISGDTNQFIFASDVKLYMDHRCITNCDFYTATVDINLSIAETRSITLGGTGNATIVSPPTEFIYHQDGEVGVTFDLSYPPVFNRAQPFNVHMSINAAQTFTVGSGFGFINNYTLQIYAVDDFVAPEEIPEPSTLGISALGIAALLYHRRKHAAFAWHQTSRIVVGQQKRRK